MAIAETCEWCKNPNKLNDMKCGFCSYPEGYSANRSSKDDLPKDNEFEHFFRKEGLIKAISQVWKDHFLTNEICTWCGSHSKPKGGNCPICTHNETPEQYAERLKQYREMRK